MEPEDQLDRLLAQRHAVGADGAVDADPAQNGQRPLGELLNAADQFAVWGAEDPTPMFARRLEADLLARFAANPRHEAEDSAHPRAGVNALPDSADIPTTPAAHVDARGREPWRAPRPLLGRRRPRPLQWVAAAAIVLIISAGALGAAASRALPDQPLYGLRRLESAILPASTKSAEVTARQRLQNAQQALIAFNTAVAQHEDAHTIDIALVTFAQQEQLAVTSIIGLQSGGNRDALVAQLEALQHNAQQDLRTALPGLDWVTRANVTAVLGQLGEPIPRVTQAGIAGVTINGDYIWIITINGSDFSSTALLLVDGQPMGTIVSRSSTTIVAHIPGNDLSPGSHALGVGNLDDTASMISGVSSVGAQDDHGGSGGSGSKNGSGDGSGSGGHDGARLGGDS
jgi:hypothetical protein